MGGGSAINLTVVRRSLNHGEDNLMGVVQETPDNEQLSALFEQAELFVDTGKHPQAEQVLEDIIQTYPGTEYALDAQRRLT